MEYFHTALSVRDMARSQKFYEDVFGFKLKSETERPELKIAYLEDASGAVIELFEHANASPLAENLMDYQRIGFKHIAFTVENIETVIEVAVQHGATLIRPLVSGAMVKRKAFIADPDGLAVELVEI